MDARELLEAHESELLIDVGGSVIEACEALRAVLIRHRDDGTGHCVECVEVSLSFGHSEAPFPCPTVQDITVALETR